MSLFARRALAVIALAALVAVGAAASGQSDSAAKTGPVTLTYFSPDMGRILKEDAPNFLELQKRLNMKIDANFVPSAEFTQKLNVMVASGEMPDVVKINGYDYAQYVPQGVLLPLNDLVEKLGPNLKKQVPQAAWELSTVNGKIYAVPSYNWPGKYVYSVRKDWLEKTSQKVPTTLDELYAVLKKLKTFKPDGYPYASYGAGSRVVFMPIFGAYGVQPAYFTLKDGKVSAGSISAGYREALRYIKKLYDEKLVDPEALIESSDQAREKLLRDRSGSFNAWWSIVPTILMDQYKMTTITPGADWSIVNAVKGQDGSGGMIANNRVSHTTVIAQRTKVAEAAMKFLDYLVTNEGFELAFYGIKGADWTEKDGQFAGRTEQGNKAFSEKWLDPFSQTVLRTDLVLDAYRINNPPYWVYIRAAADQPLLDNLFEGIITPEVQTFIADLNKYEEESFIKFVTGTMSIDQFADYVKLWKDKGGQKIQESLLKEYNKRKGTSFTLAL